MFRPGTVRLLPRSTVIVLPVGVGVGFTCPAVVDARGLKRHESIGNQMADGPMVFDVTLYTSSTSVGTGYSYRAATYGNSNSPNTHKSGYTPLIVSLIASLIRSRGNRGSSVTRVPAV